MRSSIEYADLRPYDRLLGLESTLQYKYHNLTQLARLSATRPSAYKSPSFLSTIMQFFTKTLGLLSIFAVLVSGASKFANTCQNIDGSGTTLRAECPEHENGPMRSTTLDLNRCIKNSKGGLKCGKNGNYAGSCINCSIRGHADFECQCRNADRDHKYVSAHIDLNKCISNSHGELSC
ncbi:uncharacterized protein N7459_001984 [Penicillium hispanicum]|uniref:uncharacterized protein n=1 Tax=Penicillium hispanicum TaxID=1080232 RepID=UPI0025411DFB|nr:uncharacterized protein N7459_001984 [Penicillium hispanicum]KAJ5591615.1 hypothetical protein N7459_001984 [Penicillium hispanicum]